MCIRGGSKRQNWQTILQPRYMIFGLLQMIIREERFSTLITLKNPQQSTTLSKWSALSIRLHLVEIIGQAAVCRVTTLATRCERSLLMKRSTAVFEFIKCVNRSVDAWSILVDSDRIVVVGAIRYHVAHLLCMQRLGV